MITPETYSLEHILYLQNKSKRDPSLIERVLFAFGLLEALKKVELPFIFKGGTSLLLILNTPMRLSTDIDIIVEPGIQVDSYLKKAAEIFPFESYSEQIRKGKNNIEKRHFKFQFHSPRSNEPVEIILDILFETCKYAKLLEKDINCDLLLTTPDHLTVKVPDINSILADKLTAFAPHTTGVLLGTKKDLEIMKQMFDVYSLINSFDNFEIVYDTYHKIVKDEIAYRGINITAKEVLKDTYEAALCIASRGSICPNDYQSYLKGIRSLSGHVYSLNYSAEIASIYAPIIMYLCACLMINHPFERIDNIGEYLNKQHKNKELIKSLKSLRKRNLLAYAYSLKAEELMIHQTKRKDQE